MDNLVIKSLTPLAEKMAGIGVLETEYLKQERLILPLPGLMPTVSLEQYMLTNYDLFFRKPLAAGVYEAYCMEHPEAHEAVTDEPMKACMMWMDGTKGGQAGFCCPSSRVLKKSLQDRGHYSSCGCADGNDAALYRTGSESIFHELYAGLGETVQTVFE